MVFLTGRDKRRCGCQSNVTFRPMVLRCLSAMVIFTDPVDAAPALICTTVCFNCQIPSAVVRTNTCVVLFGEVTVVGPQLPLSVEA